MLPRKNGEKPKQRKVAKPRQMYMIHVFDEKDRAMIYGDYETAKEAAYQISKLIVSGAYLKVCYTHTIT